MHQVLQLGGALVASIAIKNVYIHTCILLCSYFGFRWTHILKISASDRATQSVDRQIGERLNIDMLRERLLQLLPGGDVIVRRSHQVKAEALKLMAHVYACVFIVLHPNGFLSIENLNRNSHTRFPMVQNIELTIIRGFNYDIPAPLSADDILDFGHDALAFPSHNEFFDLMQDAEHLANLEKNKFINTDLDDPMSDEEQVLFPNASSSVLAIPDSVERDTSDVGPMDDRFKLIWNDSNAQRRRCFRDHCLTVIPYDSEDVPFSGYSETKWCVRFYLDADSSSPWGEADSWQALWTRVSHYNSDCLGVTHTDLCRSLNVSCCYSTTCSIASLECQLVCQEIKKFEESFSQCHFAKRRKVLEFHPKKMCICDAVRAWTRVEAVKSRHASRAASSTAPMR